MSEEISQLHINKKLFKKIHNNLSFPRNLGVLIMGFEHDEISLDGRESINHKEEAKSHSKASLMDFFLPGELFLRDNHAKDRKLCS